MTPLQVAVRLGVEYADDELRQVEALCDDVSALIRSRLPLIDTWIADGLLSLGAVVAVAVQVVARCLTSISTGGVGVRSVQHPEYGYELTSSTASGLALTNREVSMLVPAEVHVRPFSVHVTSAAA